MFARERGARSQLSEEVRRAGGCRDCGTAGDVGIFIYKEGWFQGAQWKVISGGWEVCSRREEAQGREDEGERK